MRLGSGALRSQGPVSREKPTAAQRARLEAEPTRELLAPGFADDQRGTLALIPAEQADETASEL